MSPYEVKEKQLLVDELDNAVPIKTRKLTGYYATSQVITRLKPRKLTGYCAIVSIQKVQIRNTE